MANREEKRNLETIPVGSLGIISLPGCKPLGEKVDQYLVNGEQREKANTKSLWHLQAIRENPIFWMPKYPVSVPVRQRDRFWNPSAVLISIC